MWSWHVDNMELVAGPAVRTEELSAIHLVGPPALPPPLTSPNPAVVGFVKWPPAKAVLCHLRRFNLVFGIWSLERNFLLLEPCIWGNFQAGFNSSDIP